MSASDEVATGVYEKLNGWDSDCGDGEIPFDAR